MLTAMKKKSILVLCRVVPIAIVFALGVSSTTDLIANPAKLALSIFQQNCVDCHGGAEVNADVNLKTLRNARHLRNAPGLLIKAVSYTHLTLPTKRIV